MLDRISTFLSDKKKKFIDQLGSNKSRVASNGLCCISISPKEFAFVYARLIAGKVTIKFCESHAYSDQNNLQSKLSHLVKKYKLKNVPCSLMLQPDDYQLLVSDALPVKESEFQAAIRWKVKDLLNFPLEDVVIDSFVMPKMKNNVNKIMVVAAQMSRLKSTSELIQSSGLQMKFIDIPELALRNITVLFEKNDEASMLIYVQEKSIQLLITQQKQIYVSRGLKFSLNNQAVNIERLAAEIQRSFDYYQSLWDFPNPTHMVLAATKLISAEDINLLSQKIKSPIEIIKMSDIASSEPIEAEKLGKFLLEMGEVLKLNVSYQQEINLYQFLPQKTGFELTPKAVLVSYGAFLAFLLILHLGSLLHNHKLVNQLDQLNKDIALQQNQLMTLIQKYPIYDMEELRKSINQLQDEFSNKEQILDLLSPNANFSSYLIGLGNAIVPGVWLTEIIFDRGQNKIQLKGYTLQPTLLEQFYRKLESQANFSDLRFKVNEIKQTSYPASFLITAKVNKT